MKKSNFILLLLTYALASEPTFQGRPSPQNDKSMKAKLKACEKQLQSLEDQVLGRKLNGRKKLELLSSLEDDAYQSKSENQIYLNLKELLGAIEEDYRKSVSGGLNKRGFRQHVKAYKQNIQNLRTALGLSRTSSKPRRQFQARMVTEK